jgi:hypothetical protein
LSSAAEMTRIDRIGIRAFEQSGCIDAHISVLVP